jgi:hypothetical protein
MMGCLSDDPDLRPPGMMYADTATGRAEAARGLVGTCPSCGHPCRPKCGQIIVNHWAHHARADCDPWAEPMTEWHWTWQQAVPPDRREVVMGPHRADIVTASGGVVEVQHSSISPAMIREREDFYGERMAWIFDATDAFRAGRLSVDGRAGEWDAVKWMSPRSSIEACRRPVLLDVGNGMVLQLHQPHGPTSLTWCRPVTRASVETWLLAGGSWQVRRIPPAPRRIRQRGCGCTGIPQCLLGGDCRAAAANPVTMDHD